MEPIPAEKFLAHYGIIRESGRYPWGSGGDTPAKRSKTFFDMVNDLKSQGLSRVEIAQAFGMTTTELQSTTTLAKNAQRLEKQQTAEKLRAKSWSTSAIGREMGLNESSVRQLLDPSVQARTRVLETTANMLRDEVDKGGWIDIGKGVENNLGLSKEKLGSAVSILKDEGYEVIKVQQDQPGQATKTTYKVLCPPGTTYKDVVTSKELIRNVSHFTDNYGKDFQPTFLPPLSVDPKRVAVKYKEDGGDKEDGMIYVRPGVKDVNLGGSAYAQVRINVGGTHYLKGMAVYKKDLPPGVDLQFCTNKSKTDPKILKGGKMAALKEQTNDKDDPFGAVVRRQITEIGPDGKRVVTSAMNILNEEGTWDTWSRNLSSQVLSKQSPKLAKEQLDKTFAKKKQALDEILALTNPTVKAKLLQSFSDEADSSAVHLSAAGMPRSSYHVILPFNKLKDTEVYAPNFQNGERVTLIRYPHGGTFEIPELTVNNNHPPAKAAIGRAKDAIGINHKVAARMSGADFDGDFVMVIPNDKGSIKTSSPLKQLENFDPMSFKLPDEAPRMSAKTKGKQMGDVSNLITDMTIKKASMQEISQAVRHSMVVIDAEKHHLDYKRSAQVHGIAALKERYQGSANAGASTLISRATSEKRVNKRRAQRASDGGPIDPATGKKLYTETGEMRTITKTMKRTGEVRVTQTPVTQRSVKLAETDDAHSLSSGTLIEKVYADHSNRLKNLANESRREMVSLTPIPYSPTAKKVFSKEVAELDSMLNIALMNSPRERQALTIANTMLAAKVAARPDMDAATLKKERAREIKKARERVGAKKELVELEDRHWEAIQAGAITPNKLKSILDNADIEQIKTLATPRPKLLMDAGTTARAQAMAANGLTQAEIARALGVSLSTLKEGLG
jgi:hypothetical protein